MPAASDDTIVQEGYRERERVVRAFFATHSRALARVCHQMARRFAMGGRLLAFGVGPAATDAQHVSVEFVHPVIVGKRALPAHALPNDGPSTSILQARDPGGFLARQLEVGGRPADIALGMVHGPEEPGTAAVAAALARADALGMLTVGLSGTGSGPDAEHDFAVPCDDPFVVQEVHETVYHVLWELVHVFFDHKGLLEGRPPHPTHDPGRSGFLYPFLAEAERDLESVLAEVERSILQKAADVIAVRWASCDPPGLAAAARLVTDRLAAGGKVLALGNGGSATDAQDLVTDLTAAGPERAAAPALALTGDAAVVTAVGNDVGFDNVFARQVIAHGAPEDVVVAISTSGRSRNVLAAVDEANRRGIATVGLSGYGGGPQARCCTRSLVVDADYIPRIQEAQATQYHLLLQLLAGCS